MSVTPTATVRSVGLDVQPLRLAHAAALAGMVGPLSLAAFLPRTWPSVRCDPSGAANFSAAGPTPPS